MLSDTIRRRYNYAWYGYRYQTWLIIWVLIMRHSKYVLKSSHFNFVNTISLLYNNHIMGQIFCLIQSFKFIAFIMQHWPVFHIQHYSEKWEKQNDNQYWKFFWRGISQGQFPTFRIIQIKNLIFTSISFQLSVMSISYDICDSLFT